MLPASLPKRILLWPCIIYLLTRGDSIIIGFQAHKRASLSAQADRSESYFCELCVFFKYYVHSLYTQSYKYFQAQRKATLNKSPKKKNVVSNYFTMKNDLAGAVQVLFTSKPRKFIYQRSSTLLYSPYPTCQPWQ